MGMVFISHSKHDKELVDNLKSIIENLDHRTYLYEYEEHDLDESPNIEIQTAIRSSNFIFVFLSDNIVTRDYTSSWVISETAIAREAGKRIFVFKPMALSKNLIIPYLTDLVIYNKDDIKDMFNIQRIAKEHFQKTSIIKREMVGGGIGALLGAPFGPLGIFLGVVGGAVVGNATKPKELDIIEVHCEKCNNKYSYYSPLIKTFNCPICDHPLEVKK